jgi:hypothetical protein
MVKRVAGHFRHGRPEHSSERVTKRWLKQIIAAIVTLGAVATAITAVLTFKLPVDPEDSATATVRALPRVPLSEYLRRLEANPPKKFGGITSARPMTTGEAPYTTPVGTPPPVLSSRLPPPPSITLTTRAPISRSADSGNTSVPEDPTTTTLLIGPPDSLGIMEYTQRPGASLTGYTVDILAGELSENDGTHEARRQTAIPLAIGNSVDPQGNPAPPQTVVDRVLKILRDARTVGGGQEPVGVLVSADIELTGLHDKPVMLTWSMYQAAGETRLHGDWLNSNLAYRLQARTNRDTTSVDLWIPLPLSAGSYFVRVDLIREDGSPLARAESEPFE